MLVLLEDEAPHPPINAQLFSEKTLYAALSELGFMLADLAQVDAAVPKGADSFMAEFTQTEPDSELLEGGAMALSCGMTPYQLRTART